MEEKAAPVLPAATLDLKRGSSDFAYNDNGALTMDGTRGITSIAYDDNGSPAGIQFANGSATDTLTLAFKYFNKDHVATSARSWPRTAAWSRRRTTIPSDSP